MAKLSKRVKANAAKYDLSKHYPVLEALEAVKACANAKFDESVDGLGVLHGLGDVRGHGTDLRVRHQAARPEDLAQLTHNAHRIRRGDHDVEVELTGLHFSSEVIKTHDISAGGLGFFSRSAVLLSKPPVWRRT